MATNIFANITARGTKAAFENAMEALPQVWRNHVTEVPSDAPDESHVWMGMLPKPTEFLGENEFKGILDFSFDVTNKTYNLAFIISEESMEDDRHGLVNRRIAEAAEVWGSFKDEQFKDLLEDNGSTTYDGTAFFADTRVIGASANIDNSLADTAVAAATPTAPEFLDSLQLMLNAMWTFQDDQGRTGYNAGAMSTLRVVVPAKYERAATEALTSTLIGGGNSNPWGLGRAEIDVLAYLTASNHIFFATANGATRKPFLYQERTPLQITVINSPEQVAQNNGVVVRVRQRYRMTYGEMRRATKMTLTDA